MIVLLAEVFCLNLAVGIAGALLVLCPEDLEPKFFRVNGIIATVLVVVAFFLLRATGEYSISNGVSGLSVLLLLYSSLVIRLPRGLERAGLGCAIVWGGSILWELLSMSMEKGMFLRVADFIAVLSGGWLLGLALVAMNVGHWYLSAVKLSIRPLRNTTLFLGGVLIFRTLWLAIGLPVLSRMFPAVSADLELFFRMEEITNLSIGMIRVLFGLIGPLILTYMTWETVKLHATQSATGILYALLAMVLVGEASAFFVTLTTHVPA